MIREALLSIQKELKAPKGQYNSFGGYHYRSCEDILEAVKPLLEKHKLTLTISDELVYVGERYYIAATASVRDDDGAVSVKAYAREPDTKKGMDSSQITGTASSYARKYALNGLFLIDDTKDADTDAYKKQSGEQQTEKVPMMTKKQSDYIKTLVEEKESRKEIIKKRVSDWKTVTAHDATELIDELLAV